MISKYLKNQGLLLTNYHNLMAYIKINYGILYDGQFAEYLRNNKKKEFSIALLKRL